LVAAQVALTLVLLTGAGLMMRTFWSLFRTDLGIETRDLTVMRVDTAGSRFEAPEQRAALYDALEERLRAVPLLSGAAVASIPPGAGGPPQWALIIDGRAAGQDKPPLVSVIAVGDDYFRMLDQRMIRGRAFERRDGIPGHAHGIVNERLTSMYFPSENPVGRRIRVSRTGRAPMDSGWVTIIGVAPTIIQRNALLGRGPDPVVYVPYRSQPSSTAVLLAKGSDIGSVTRQVRAELLALDPALPVFDVQSLDQFHAFFRWPQRVFGSVLMILAAIALVLATVGLYAIVAYSVVQRTHEIGVRVALGAQRRQVLLLVLQRAVIPFGGGLVVGAAGVLLVGQLLAAFLMDTNPRDPVTLLGVSALLCGVGLAACVVPARRAAKLDPLAALRCQ
jgi:predicted permease